MKKSNYDLIIIGSGIAGLNAAISFAKIGKVLIITKSKVLESNTYYAQGGIVGILDKKDNQTLHVHDTLKAGSMHNKIAAVKEISKFSKESVLKLENYGVKFAKENGEIKLTKEGGHSKSRIAYIGDYTGKVIAEKLYLKAKKTTNIKILENAFVTELIIKNTKCFGVKVLFDKKLETYNANLTVIATGGIGQIYKFTSNPKIATADGLAMAIKARAKVKDLEFIQFHPTTFKNGESNFLISEAVRGEGAKLLNNKKERFMKKHHHLAELAPRDIVSKAIFQEQKKGAVYLDAKELKENPKNRFPKIYQMLKENGYDMNKDLIPVTPAAHYHCGGIETDLNGKTSIENLYAYGEVACTGAHGANRLASNSLLEAMVFSSKMNNNNTQTSKIQAQAVSTTASSQDCTTISPSQKETDLNIKLKKEIQELMWNFAGIIRNLEKVKKIAIPKIKKILSKLEKIKSITPEIQETKNIAISSLAILKAISKRKKSLGCHQLEHN